VTSVAGLCMWKDDSNLMDPSLPFPCSFLFLFQYFLHFREAVIRLLTLGLVRGKSGHQRAGFLVKAGGACFKTSSRPVPQKTNRLTCEVRVKRWGKSPPLFKQLNGHGKPNPMQDEIGNRAARLWFRVRRTLLWQGFNLWVG
jgi:hypothetical protein